MKVLTAIFVILCILVVVTTATAEISAPPNDSPTYQGKSAEWWAKRAVQNRKNSNARGVTIKRLKKSINHNSDDRGMREIGDYRLSLLQRIESLENHRARIERQPKREESDIDSEWPIPVPDIDLCLDPLRPIRNVDMESLREQSSRWLDASKWPGE